MSARSKLRPIFILALQLALILPILAACGGTAPTTPPTTGLPATGGTAAPAATSTGSTGSGEAAPPEQQILRVRLVSEPASIDPAQDQDTTQETVIKQLFTGLTRLNNDLKPEPALAESWKFNPDNTQVIFSLKDTKWSDGQPLTAKDFEYAWKRFIDPRTASPYVSLVTGVIKGATALSSTPISDTAALQKALDGLGVKAVDDKHLQVDLEISAPFFTSIAALGNLAPVRKDVIDKYGDKWTEVGNLIGNGPFVLKSWTKGTEMTIVPNSNYYDTAPTLTSLTFKFIADDAAAFASYQADDLDVTQGIPQPEVPGVRNNPQFKDQIIQSSQLATYFFGFNTTKPPFDNVKVRQAFSEAIDRKTLTEQVLNGIPTPAYSFIPPGMPGHLTQEQVGDAAQTFDPAKAKQLLADAGFPNGQGFPEVKLAFNNNSGHALIAQRVQSDLQNNLGIKITLDPREPRTYFNDIQKNPPDFFRSGWNADYPDPYDWDRLVLGPDSSQNYGHWKNDQFTKLIEQADKETDPDKRIAIYQQAEKVAAQDVGNIFVYWYGRFSLVKPWVKGLSYTAQDPTVGTYSYKDAKIVAH